MIREARSSEDYVRKLANTPKLDSRQKKAKLGSLLKQADGMSRLGQGMVGPILLRLRYEGVVRNILIEDPLTNGAELVYDVLDDLGQAFFLNDNESEVKVTPFEGKRVGYSTFRVAAFPTVKKDDLYALRVDVVEHAQEESKQAILKAEDSRLFTLLEGAIAGYAANPNHAVTPDHAIEATGGLTAEALNEAAGIIELHELEAKTFVGNPMDIRAINTWSLDNVGWKFKDSVVDGMKVTKFGEFTIQRSIMVEQGNGYLLPEARFLGMMPVRYSLDSKENNNPEKFQFGWVLDEVIGMVILNPRGLAKITIA